MEFEIFSKIDITALSQGQAVKNLLNYQDLAQNIKIKYDLLRRAVAMIEDAEEAKNTSVSIFEFRKKFDFIYQQASVLIHDEMNVTLAADKIKEYDALFNNIEPIYEKHKALVVSEVRKDDPQYKEYADVTKDLIDQLNIQWSTLQSHLSDKIEQGINSVLEIKDNYGITSIFKDQIESEIIKNRNASDLYFKSFKQILLLIPLLMIFTYFIDEWINLSWDEGLLLRLSIVLPLLWLAKWFSRNYAYAQLASIKFDHLNRLLGNGMPTIAKLVEADPKAKSEVYNRFAELILDIKDLTGMANKQPAHPTEDIKELIDMHKKLQDLFNNK